MISVDEAQALIRGHLPGDRQWETVTLNRCIGRVLAQDVWADRDQPPFDRVAMDGAAFTWDDLEKKLEIYPVEGLQKAGDPVIAKTGSGTSLEVATGAVMPQGWDTVVPYEDLMKTPQGFSLKFRKPPKPGQNIHFQGSDYKAGDRLLPPGTHLGTGHIHILATVGMVQVPVWKQAIFSLASTGDELVEPSAQPEAHQIRRSNTPAMEAEALTWGLVPEACFHLPDKKGPLAEGISRMLETSDVVVLTGGVSQGAFDLIPVVLTSLGCREVFHQVAQKPGKPLWFGVGPQGQLVFGLPGNPVSSLFSFRRYVIPALLAWEGRSLRVRQEVVRGLYSGRSGGTHFLPVQWGDQGLELLPAAGSGNFFHLADSDGFVEVREDFNPGILPQVPFYSWGLRKEG